MLCSMSKTLSEAFPIEWDLLIMKNRYILLWLIKGAIWVRNLFLLFLLIHCLRCCVAEHSINALLSADALQLQQRRLRSSPSLHYSRQGTERGAFHLDLLLNIFVSFAQLVHAIYQLTGAFVPFNRLHYTQNILVSWCLWNVLLYCSVNYISGLAHLPLSH